MRLRTDENFEHRHLSCIIAMQECLYNKYKVEATEQEIADAWEEYSNSWAAGWLAWDADDWRKRVDLLDAMNYLQLRQDDDYPVDTDYDMENDLR